MHSLVLVFLVFATHELAHLLFHPFLKRVATMETKFLSPEWCPFAFLYFGVSLLKLNIREKGTLVIEGLLRNLGNRKI